MQLNNNIRQIFLGYLIVNITLKHQKPRTGDSGHLV